MLTIGNPKTAKGEKFGVLTGVLHLAPASSSGFNVCPMATQGCIAACLNTAGRGGIPNPIVKDGETFANAIQAARVRKTRQYFNDRPAFLAALVADIERLIRMAARNGLKPAVRLNGTSDIRWERVPVVRNGATFENMMRAFPDVQFYDYTKIANRRDLPANYHLTFSLAENNRENAAVAFANGMNVAVVFRSKETRQRYMESGWNFGEREIAVIDGDQTDLRFTDPGSVIVGLYAKGKARKDTSGFVVD